MTDMLDHPDLIALEWSFRRQGDLAWAEKRGLARLVTPKIQLRRSAPVSMLREMLRLMRIQPAPQV
jgi:hypothetical protein